MFARLETRIEAARPAPLFDVGRDAGALTDRANAHVTEIDAPAVTAIGRLAAGKVGHAHMIPPFGREGKPQPAAAGNPSPAAEAVNKKRCCVLALQFEPL